ncbi:MAG: response regulator [Deltaproteobacteria bacterium]|nr:response regulator [Deltaproteobacteria bacterium]
MTRIPAEIVVIEDDPPSLDLITYLLRAAGYVVHSAVDGAQGLALAQRQPPDLLLCDIHLPSLDGLEIARRLRADPSLRHIPLIAVTASAMVGDRQAVLAAGFDAYIAKPIVPEEFVAQVSAALAPAQRQPLG